MQHLLLDVNIVVDLCVPRVGTERTETAIALAEESGLSIWVYAGSVQTLEYVTVSELRTALTETGITLTRAEFHSRAKDLLATMTATFGWLAALAGEGAVFASEDPEDEQLIRALHRFAADSIRLLTRDKALLARADGRALTPEAWLEESSRIAETRRVIDFVDLKKQQAAIRPQLELNIHRVLHHGHYILGPEVRELEDRLAAYTGAKHCITVASGTEALLISLMALGIGPGDEVITTPFTFVATAEVIVLVGATPVFVDIEPDTCNIDATQIESRITAKTKAIMPVSLYG